MNLLEIGNIILSVGADSGSIGAFISAHLNADFAMGAAFSGLIFICIIIYLSKKDRTSETASPSVGPDSFQTTEIENLTDNSELVAVITAAIMASMGDEAPADGLFIRSIKRTSGNRWKNA